MHGGDDTNLQMALMNLAFVWGTFGSGNDARFMRGRIAFLLWMPGFLLVLMLAVAVQAPIVVPVGITLLLAALWMSLARAPKKT